MNNSRSLGAMSAMKDPTTIKLFGKTIPCSQRIVSASAAAAADRDDQHEDCCKEMEVECYLADDLKDQNDTTTHQDPEDKYTMNEDTDSSTFETPNETSIISEAKALIPDKILPCPRCNSLETKFCYFNNYNIKQPRHFCKNCQRYWTAGGSMRNLPVGSGRRKNKHNSTSLYRHIITSGTLQSATGYTSAALKFRSDVPLSDSVASCLSLLGNTQNSSVTATSSSLQKLGNDASLQDQRIIAAGKSFHQGHAGQVLPGPHWRPWNSGIPPPHFGPLGHPPISFYPQPTFWSSWNHQQQPLMSPTSTTSNNSSLLSSYLGKHSREDGDKLSLLSMSSQEQSLKEKCVLVPKTLRIGDPNEAANSSIRATLRMQNEKTSSIGEAGVFHKFQSKSNNPHRIGHKSPAMQANPAALSRSRIFQEGT